jgi:hypothetical protein
MPIVEYSVMLLGIPLLALWRFIPDTVFEFLSGRLGRAVPVAADDHTRKIMAVVVTIAVLASALFVVLSGRYPGDVQKWAFGAIGTVFGYWLPSGK